MASPVAVHAGDTPRQVDVARRGADVIPFSLKATTLVFTATSDGGTQRVVAKRLTDTKLVDLVRAHLHDLRAQFLKDDFSGPSHIHGTDMPDWPSSRHPGSVRWPSTTRTWWVAPWPATCTIPTVRCRGSEPTLM